VGETAVGCHNCPALVQGHSKPRGFLDKVRFTDTLSVHQKNRSDKRGGHNPDMVLQNVDHLVAKFVVEFLPVFLVVEWVKLRVY